MPEPLETFLDSLDAHLEHLRDRVVSGEADDTELGVLDDVLAQLSVTREELRVMGDELSEQMAGLTRTAEALEAQRRHYEELFQDAPDAYLFTTRGGAIREANRAAQRLLGAGERELAHQPITAFADDDSHRPLFRAMTLARSSGRAQELRIEMRPAHGPPFVASLHLAATVHAGDTAGLRWLVRDVTDDNRHTEELTRTVDSLRETDEVKNAFLLAVAHDLRSPVNAIVGLTRTLRGLPDPVPATQLRRFMDQLERNTDALERLQTDLLDLQRLERGAVRPFRRPVDLAALIEQVVKRIDFGTRALETALEPTVARVDPGLVENLVEKLLHNAKRHTPPGTTIWVQLRRDDEGHLIVVEDDGPGVPPEMSETIFELFRRGNAARGAVGIGAGLHLARRFAELHGGTVWLEPRNTGGASFRVRLADGG